MIDQRPGLDDFVMLSAALTGIKAEQLKPELDPINLAGEYLNVLWNQADRGAFLSLIQTFQGKLPNRPSKAQDAAKAAEFVLADARLGPLARSIIKLWLLGIWYEPATPQKPVKVVSAQAYKEALIWKVMRAHPMGYSTLSYGHWERKPAPLDEFVKLELPLDADK